MKKLLLLLLTCCCAGPALAQTPTGADSLRTALDAVFTHLDKSQVPTGYLAEYAVPLTRLAAYNGTLADSNRTNANIWRLTYATLATSRIYGTSTLPRLDTLSARLARADRSTGAIPIMLQRLTYASIRPDAVAAGLLTVQNQQLYDVPGRSQSPYQYRTLFVAGPQRTYSKDGQVAFVLPQNLHVQSGGGSVRSLDIDFGDGQGYRTTTWGQPIATTYANAGTYRVKVRGSYNLNLNGPYKAGAVNSAGAGGMQAQAAGPPAPAPQYESYESHFDLIVLQGGVTASRYDTLITAPIPFIGDAATSGARVHIRYGSNHTQLTKPLIVVEGYDPHFVAPSLQRNYSIERFLEDLNVDDNAFPTPFNFSNDLDNTAAYDIVFIDFANGADDIRRNAEVFERIVRWVNMTKVVDPAIGQRQANVVLGISMGGLVARYGLARMTKRGNDSPDTRLLLTQDSPHRGANTPLGVQALTRQAVNATNLFTLVHPVVGLTARVLFPQLDEANGLLDAPATRQLLLLRALDGTGGTGTDSFLTGDYRTTITFPAGGPQPGYQFKAVSLGSQCGQWTLQPYTELAHADARYFTGISPYLRYGPRFTTTVNALPHYAASQRISGLRVFVELDLPFGISFTRNIFSQSFHSPYNVPCWDGVPGGTTALSSQLPIAPDTDGFDWVVIGGNYVIQAADRFCFVPTVSALDIADINPATLAGRYVGNVASASYSRANAFIAEAGTPVFSPSRYNFPHPFFRGRQAHWLYNEMEGIPNTLACSTECSPYANISIAGPATICVNSAGNYTLAGAPANAVANWTVSGPAGIFVSSSSGNTAQITAGSALGNYTVTANLVTPCGLLPFSRGNSPSSRLSVVDRATVTIASATHGTPTLQSFYEATTNSDGDLEWSVYVDGVLYDTMLGSSVKFTNPPTFCIGKQILVEVRVLSPCAGDGEYVYDTDSYILPAQQPNGTGCRPAAGAYPNPATTALTVNRPATAAATGPLTVRLYDAMSQERAGGTLAADAATLNTAALPAGIYYLHILDGKQVLHREQIRIER